ncbi:MAG TPA: recombination protein O N-terminal domain-containing protein [Candidatus Paceibacterota bacterium]
MHSLVEVDALVIGGKPRGEADRYVTLLTRERGLIQARSIGVRAERSKLRYAVQDFALLRCYLVRGKTEWRLTNAVLLRHFHADLAAARALPPAARVASLVSRLVHGEGEHPAECASLFATVESAWSMLASGLDADSADALEAAAALKILRALGYLAETPGVPVLSADPAVTFEAVAALAPARREAIEAINRALRESHL